MMRAMSLSQLQQVTAGHLLGSDAEFSAVSTDTRTLQTGELFVALQGPNFNGNRFVDAAAAKGAVAALVSESLTATVPTVQVVDTRIALGKLGKHNRLASSAAVIALTGSQGKTTVKEMTASILQQAGLVLSTQGNLNNDYGVPLTLLRIDSTHRFAVIEMGANAGGEIAYTTELAQPDIAHITCVAPTHVEGFGSLDGVALAKAEIWQGVRSGGVAVVNMDDANVVARFQARADVSVVSISASGNSDATYRLTAYQDLGLQGSIFSIATAQTSGAIRLPLPGKHNAANALAAAALALEAGATFAQVQAGLQHVHSVKGRLVVKAGLNGAVILDDTYNASPTSFNAAIDVLAAQPGMRIVVGGDMGELGALTIAGHRDVGAYAKAKGIDQFFATGIAMKEALAAFGNNSVHADDWAALAQALRPLLNTGVTVLVKGSRSAGMERVVQLLVTERLVTESLVAEAVAAESLLANRSVKEI
jgi:UDP-N-acetylmuramoyl-tripeptide--D-alanyl-D-alanine ligase